MGRASDLVRRIRGKFSATPGYGVVGFDQAEKIRSIAGWIDEAGKAGALRLKEADSHWKYETRESYVCLARRITSPQLRREGFEVVTATEVPGCGTQASGKAWTIEDAEVELRLHLAQLYLRAKVVRDYDEARERAAKVELHTERSFILGSK